MHGDVTITVTSIIAVTTNASLHITKEDGSTNCNNSVREGSTITGNDKNWKIYNAGWFQGYNDYDHTAKYKIFGIYYINEKKEKFESVDVIINASMIDRIGSACICGGQT